jgi:hypothetical protein
MSLFPLLPLGNVFTVGKQEISHLKNTCSGKSLIYQLPVLESLLKDKTSKALYIFPTKALAQDQMRALSDMLAQIPDLEGILVSFFFCDLLVVYILITGEDFHIRRRYAK